MTNPLSAFRADPPKEKPKWVSPVWEDFAYGLVLGVDQSIAAFGWTLLRNDPRGFHILSAGSIHTRPHEYPTGHEGTLQRAVRIYEDFYIYTRQALGFDQDGLVIAHEMPPVGSRMIRPESSLLSALSVRLVARALEQPVVMVANQRSKSVLTGNANSDKGIWHKALEMFAFTNEGRSPRNEGERDALLLAMTYLYDLKGDK